MYGKTFSIIGGDERMLYVAEKLFNCGFCVVGYGLKEPRGFIKNCETINDAVSNAKYIVLGLPYSKDGENVYAPFCDEKIALDSIYSAMRKDAILFGGNIKFNVEKTIRVFDYYKREELQIKNAAITAECALTELANSGISVSDKRILIVGYGRIGKCLAWNLKSKGADVAVTARKNTDAAWAEAMGVKAYQTSDMAEIINEYDIVFNTVPAVVINEDVLRKTRQNTLFAELASNPGGIDRACAEALDLKVTDMPSLPGRLAPQAAGFGIAETILNIIDEEKLR